MNNSEIDVRGIRLRLGLSQEDMARRMGVTTRTIQNWEAGRKIPLSKYEMLDTLAHQNVGIVHELASHVVLIPLVSQYAYAGYASGYGDDEYMENLPTVPFVPDREMTGNYMAFEVKGDSMDDGTRQAYLEGDILICREVEPYLWRDSKLHINKRDFVIVTDSGVLVKRISAHDVENHKITIHSLNEFYPEREIDLVNVRQIFSIVSLTRSVVRR